MRAAPDDSQAGRRFDRLRSPRRRMKDLLKRCWRATFEAGQRFGVDVLPRHYYSSIPDIRALKSDRSWATPFNMAAVSGADLGSQLGWASHFSSPQIRERFRTHDIFSEAVARNGELGFGPADAEFLFAFVATQKPSQIVQIGCGVSTAVIQLAADYGHYEPNIVCIEPYPTSYLRSEHSHGRLKLIGQKAEHLGSDSLVALASGGFLFIDSTHAVRPNGEVPRLVLEVLPRLGVGSWIHFHDIFFPFNVSPNILTDDLFFWTESLLLQAFLTQNQTCKLAVSLSMLFYLRRLELQALLPNLPEQTRSHGELTASDRYPSSAYLRVEEEQ